MTETVREKQVLEFELGDETYCVDIAHVAEIVDVDELTVVPNSPRHVEGVMDLRGKTTSIVDPKSVFGIRDDRESKRIVVFDPDQAEDSEAVGWLVDEVDQVVAITPDDVEPAPGDGSDAVQGVIKRDGEFVIWVRPADVP
ncbi:MAG: chemotaxis protein CheW [Haloferacaceae archaeon]